MKRGKPLKRNKGLKRGGRLRQRRKGYKAPTRVEQERLKIAKTGFKQSARGQLVCARCSKTGGRQNPWEAHHVITKTYLKRNGLDQWHPDNALRLCVHPCHEHHTTAFERLHLNCLLDRNIDYAVRLLGEDRAYDYLTRHYVGTDPRVEALNEDDERSRLPS